MFDSADSLSSTTSGELAELPRLAQFATDAMSIGRRHLALSQLQDALQNRGATSVFSSQVRSGETLLAAGVATRIARDAAMLVGCGQLGELADPSALRAVLDHLHQQVAAAGLRFIQATWDASEESPPFTVAEYEKIAVLDYLSLRLPVADSVTASQQGPSPLVVYAIDPRQAEPYRRMLAIMAETFEATRDCPRLNRFRSPADIVAAYRDSPAFDPLGWRIFQFEDTDVACLITTPYPSAATLELTYMGVVQPMRGRHWGQRLLEEAFRIAGDAGLTEVMLAVDQANGPAAGVYHRAGFRAVASEAVWGRATAPAEQPA